MLRTHLWPNAGVSAAAQEWTNADDGGLGGDAAHHGMALMAASRGEIAGLIHGVDGGRRRAGAAALSWLRHRAALAARLAASRVHRLRGTTSAIVLARVKRSHASTALRAALRLTRAARDGRFVGVGTRSVPS